jgi:branched-chain amino acid transport system permease protein
VRGSDISGYFMQNIIVNLIPVVMVGLSLGSLFGLVGLAYTVIINA